MRDERLQLKGVYLPPVILSAAKEPGIDAVGSMATGDPSLRSG